MGWHVRTDKNAKATQPSSRDGREEDVSGHRPETCKTACVRESMQA